MAVATTTWPRLALGAIWAVLALLLLTPLVVSGGTVYAHTVGKALYSRALIEVAVVLWVPLALCRPAYRPPRSALMPAVAVFAGVALLTAACGVDFEHSMWSSFARMRGVVDLLHWLALAVVVAGVAHSARQWRLLLGASVAVSVAVAALAVGRFHVLGLPEANDYGNPTWRMGSSLGSSAHLGPYAAVHLLLACGLAATGRRGKAGRLAWSAAALANLWAVLLAGSLAAVAALVAACGALAVLCAWRGRGRARTAGRVAAPLVGTALCAAAVAFFASGPPSWRSTTPAFDLLAKASVGYSTSRMRMAAWEAGLKAFADRPLLGWGPHNYVVPFGRHAAGLGAEMLVHDSAHNDLVEEAATKGVVGVAAYLALWALAFRAFIGGVPGRGPPRALVWCAGAALLVDFLVRQTMMPASPGWLYHALLLALAARLPPGRTPQARSARVPPAVRGAGRAVAGAVVVAAAVFALAQNRDAYAAARAFAAIQGVDGLAEHAPRAIAAFPPLDDGPRRFMFVLLGGHWRALDAADPPRADKLLALADAEAARVLRDKPGNWRLHEVLAFLYGEVAATRPEYGPRAARHEARRRALAPNRPPFSWNPPEDREP